MGCMSCCLKLYILRFWEGMQLVQGLDGLVPLVVFRWTLSVSIKQLENRLLLQTSHFFLYSDKQAEEFLSDSRKEMILGASKYIGAYPHFSGPCISLGLR